MAPIPENAVSDILKFISLAIGLMLLYKGWSNWVKDKAEDTVQRLRDAWFDATLERKACDLPAIVAVQRYCDGLLAKAEYASWLMLCCLWIFEGTRPQKGKRTVEESISGITDPKLQALASKIVSQVNRAMFMQVIGRSFILLPFGAAFVFSTKSFKTVPMPIKYAFEIIAEWGSRIESSIEPYAYS